MACVKGRPRFEVVLLRMDRDGSGRYSVRQPVESSGESAAARARGPRGFFWASGSRMGNRTGEGDPIFAIYSPRARVASMEDGVKKHSAVFAQHVAVARSSSKIHGSQLS